ncbi:nickel-type superoxide dismutase maturation protease [Thalassomonas actiniarum]|uniref:Nickel-type superoxide dismutase maturation protease n=2 Tax=Thalassomonas actiniarum TaxID=485447 RepID=A0AAF0C6E1_9GAMM|nr:nickel-type superoxide dismutase maturation protease [Thalassomonas actiniarum]
MFPRIPQSSYVLVNHWFRLRSLEVEQTVLIQHPQLGLIIKKIALIDRNGLIWSKGENSASISVEQFGPVNKNQVIGRVLKVFKKPESYSAPEAF